MKPNLSKLLEAMKPNFLKQIIIDLQVEVYLPFDGFPSLPALFIRTAILRWLSTSEMRSSFIFVFLFIVSILKNSATISRIETKERIKEHLRKASFEHFAEGFFVESIVASRGFV